MGFGPRTDSWNKAQPSGGGGGPDLAGLWTPGRADRRSSRSYLHASPASKRAGEELPSLLYWMRPGWTGAESFRESAVSEGPRRGRQGTQRSHSGAEPRSRQGVPGEKLLKIGPGNV